MPDSYLDYLGMSGDLIHGHLELLLLAILRSGPAHGYGVIQGLAERSGGAFMLPEGSVYPALYRLERAGLIASTWDKSGPRKRRLYSLTRKGRASLAERRAEWRRFSRNVNSILGWSAR